MVVFHFGIEYPFKMVSQPHYIKKLTKILLKQPKEHAETLAKTSIGWFELF